MDKQDIAYYRRRAIDERYRALEASRSEVAEIHLELARQYQALVDQAELQHARQGANPFGQWPAAA